MNVRRLVRPLMNPDLQNLLLWIGAGALFVTAVAMVVRLRRKTPEQREKERRTKLQTMGRIIDGTVTDAVELDAEKAHREIGMDLILYRYDVGGVTYEASQDVTSLRPYVDLQRCHLGLPCSVRYDPFNPANSIVVSEEWTGLRPRKTVSAGKAMVTREPNAEPETN